MNRSSFIDDRPKNVVILANPPGGKQKADLPQHGEEKAMIKDLNEICN